MRFAKSNQEENIHTADNMANNENKGKLSVKSKLSSSVRDFDACERNTNEVTCEELHAKV